MSVRKKAIYKNAQEDKACDAKNRLSTKLGKSRNSRENFPDVVRHQVVHRKDEGNRLKQ